MGNSNEVKAPSHSLWGVVLGQFMNRHLYAQASPPQVVQEVNSADLQGKRFLVTGASSGIGFEMAKLLAARGAHVLMVSRSIENLNNKVAEINEEFNKKNLQKPSLSVDTLDLADVPQVLAFSQKLLQEGTAIDCVIHNGGALPTYQVIKSLNIEETTASHLVSPFILSVMLLPLLSKAQHGARIIFNSTAGIYSQKLYPALIEANYAPCVKKTADGQPKYEDGAIVYANAKRAMLEISDLLAELLDARGLSKQILVTCAHPGWCQTPGLKPLLDQHENYKEMTFRPAIDGAYGLLWCAISKNVLPGQFYYDGQVQPKHQTFAGTQASRAKQVHIWNYCANFLPQAERQQWTLPEEVKK